MNTPRRLVQQAKKWQLMAALRNRRLVTMWPIKEASLCGSSAIADNGHCIVYTSGGERFEVPLVYHITMVLGVPCDVAVMAYVMCLLKRKPSEEVERVTVSSVVMPHGNQSGTAMVCKGLGQSLVIF